MRILHIEFEKNDRLLFFTTSFDLLFTALRLITGNLNAHDGTLYFLGNRGRCQI